MEFSFLPDISKLQRIRQSERQTAGRVGPYGAHY